MNTKRKVRIKNYCLNYNDHTEDKDRKKTEGFPHLASLTRMTFINIHHLMSDRHDKLLP